MDTSFSQADSHHQSSSWNHQETRFPRQDGGFACHHDGNAYQIPHAEPYIPTQALNLPLFLGSLAVSPILGLLVMMGTPAESTTGIRQASLGNPTTLPSADVPSSRHGGKQPSAPKAQQEAETQDNKPPART